MPRQYSVQFRGRVLGLVKEDRDVGELASVTIAVAVELADARRRIRGLEEELAATQFAASMLRDER